MKLLSLHIKNFRAIREMDLTELGGGVVLAGPNGCGKSCVLDAIRLLKSAYGSYEQDEWQNWLSEFQIGINRESKDLERLFHNPSKEIDIAGVFKLEEEEIDYLRANVDELLADFAYRTVLRESGIRRGSGALALAAEVRRHQAQIDGYIGSNRPRTQELLQVSSHTARLTIPPAGSARIEQNFLLELILSTYSPTHLGVIDYHGPHRNYVREQLAHVNFSLTDSEHKLRQHALYNYAEKYKNLKSEMGSRYIAQLIARQADPTISGDDDLTTSLKDLFTTFFPSKSFEGPTPSAQGKLTFPVAVPSGTKHDIDELSAGEKEVLYGYLRLTSTDPHHSMILIDEPELHLNPRLISGLVSFYYRHLTERTGNQLWLVTHSDTLIREAVDHPGFKVFHVHPALPGTPQCTVVDASGPLEAVIIDLVGDLAAYRPGATLVLFESTEDAAFDHRTTCILFPAFEQRVNALSVGSKRRVRQFRELLESARSAGHVVGRVVAIVDSDADAGADEDNVFRWPAYHIENFLLSAPHLLAVLRELGLVGTFSSTEQVEEALREMARGTVSALIGHRLRIHANQTLGRSLTIAFDPNRTDVATAASEAVQRAATVVETEVAKTLTPENLQRLADSWLASAEADLSSGEWRVSFRGRDVLRRFCARYCGGVPYERFRSLVVYRMASDGYQPPGMKTVIDRILQL